MCYLQRRLLLQLLQVRLHTVAEVSGKAASCGSVAQEGSKPALVQGRGLMLALRLTHQLRTLSVCSA